MSSSSNVLQISYVASDKRPVELYFRYDTFLARTGARALQRMVIRARAHVARIAPAAGKAPLEIIRAEAIPPGNIDTGHQVIVNATRVAFPPVCPVCLMLSETVVALKVDNGISDYGRWYVPICNAHRKQLRKHLRVPRWSPKGRDIKFSFTNGQYAADFLAINSGQRAAEFKRAAESTRLLYDIRNGVRFVVYQFAIGAFRVSLLTPSSVKRLEPGANRFIRGIPYSLISLILGWWSIVGPIFTIRSLITNWRGGIDLTPVVAAVLDGMAVSPLGADNTASDVALF